MPQSRYILGSLPWYSALMVVGICAAILIALREEKRLRLPKDTVIDLALWLIPCGIVGARLYYVLFAWDTFADDPISVLYIWRGGLAIYGAIIAGALAAVAFSRRRHLRLTTLMDMVAPGLILAQAIGRWGNFFNMEAYGLEITDPAWQFFPAAVLIPEGGRQVWHMATFFYESMWNLAGFAALMACRRRMRRSGDVFCWYLMLYGGGRLIIEGLRLDSLMTTGGTARVSQLLSVGLCLIVFALFAVRALGRVTPRQVASGILAALAALLSALLLPRPAAAFYGYELACVAGLSGVAGVSVALALRPGIALPRRLGALMPALVCLFTVLIRRQLALMGAADWRGATLLCGLFTIMMLSGGLAVYPVANARETAASSPNL